MTTGKTIALTTWTFVGKVMSLLFNMLSRLVIAFLPRNKCLISWLQSPSDCSDFGAQKNKVSHCFHGFPIYLPWSHGTGCHDLSFWMLSFKPAFSLSSFTFIKRLFSSSLLSAIRVVSSPYLRLLIFLLAILIPACASSSPAFRMMYSAYKLNNRVTIYSLDILLSQFGTSLLFQSSALTYFLTCIQVSQEAGQVVWYSHLLKNFTEFVVIHRVKGFGIVNKAEVDVFLELSCFFNDPMGVGNMISGSPYVACLKL